MAATPEKSSGGKKETGAGSRGAILEKWAETRKEIRDLEEKLQKLRRRKRKLEAENPWLGNILGIIKEKPSPDAGRSPRKVKEVEMPMETAAPPKKRRRKEKNNYSEEERERYKKYKSLLNKANQLSKRGKKLSPEEQGTLMALTAILGERIPEGIVGPEAPGGVNPLLVSGSRPLGENPFGLNLTGVPYTIGPPGTLDIRGDQQI
nr:TPA: delta antigen [Serinus canaria-associated deltavirus]